MKQIALWVPSVERPSWKVIDALWSLQAPKGMQLRKIAKSPANNVRFSWNKVITDFLNTKDEWILSVHDDVVVAPETLTRLLSWDKPLVSALVFMRVGPTLPHIWKTYDGGNGRMVMRINDTREWFYKHKDWIRHGAFVIEPRPEDALVPIDFTSTSCTLIHRSVLEAMRPAVNDVWFEFDDDLHGGGEDRRFFTNALAAGFPAFVDRSCVVGHLVGDVPCSAFDFVMWDSVSTFTDTGEMQEYTPMTDQVVETSQNLAQKYSHIEGD